MDRRTLLSTVGTVSLGATAGCLGTLLTPSYSEGLQARVALVSQDPTPGDLTLSVDVELLTERITGESPAHLRITSTNTGEAKLQVDYGTGRCGIFNRTKRHSDPRALWLADPTENNWERAGENGNGWKAEQTRRFGGYGCGGNLLPGKSFGTEHFVVDNGKGGPYLPEGEYRWTEEIRADTGPPYDSYPSDVAFEWGFSVAIEKP
jgi:hypothetical protein